MYKNDNAFFPFFLSSGEYFSRQSALNAFYQKANEYFKWIKGKKIWRSRPQVYSETSFETGETKYCVIARCVACDDVPSGSDIIDEESIEQLCNELSDSEELVSSTTGLIAHKKP
jgi:hypothetical protein